MMKIRTALISVYDKTGLEELARALAAHGCQIQSTGGTLAFLRERNIAALAISDYTGQEAILGGRVKTLYPIIFAGILARRSNPDDMRTLAEAGISPIDIVVVNLYPFEKTVAAPGVTIADAMEQIDIGGVALLRAAAKNHDDVLVVRDPKHYALIRRLLEGGFPDDAIPGIRRALAADAFHRTAHYDHAICEYLQNPAGVPEALAQQPRTHTRESGHDHDAGAVAYPETLSLTFAKNQDLRYGENPHQTAAFYRDDQATETSVARARQIHGKELSYNNILDLDSALELARAFEEPVCCIIKHNNPCGLARAETPALAFKAARDCDPDSAFGGVIAFNREVDTEAAAAMAGLFVEAIIAPGFARDAAAQLKKKKNLRLLETGAFTAKKPQMMLRSVVGGILAQERDLGLITREQLKVVTKLQPSGEDIEALLFAWRAAKYVKSNAIVFTSCDAAVGIGAGQMSRIDSTKIAAVKARSPIRGAFMASDAFFPFRDNVDAAADMGIRAIIQPGGSVRDEEVIAAANERGLIMVFTGMRHFRH
ncbi:MAG: bifunctional phosphoribosylaminoimidazolecarboxamide formyltransferase/IMP cyclohydrolase [bacterium]|nr:bifunctional phosphoribosylaminoimidazolecarboxamide formyltransferase/IMP cyclohydrolase [Candidatus Sumerlaeota bacterium]